ncbi:MAG: hypothetical protein WC479_10155 [Candidatus Izemoplasmatales bacterium]
MTLEQERGFAKSIGLKRKPNTTLVSEKVYSISDKYRHKKEASK